MKATRVQPGLLFSTGHTLWAAVLCPAGIAVTLTSGNPWIATSLALSVAMASVLTVRGRRCTGWIAALFSWRRRRRLPPPSPSRQASVCAVLPSDHVAVRWHGDHLTSLIELVPRPFTPTVIVDGHAHTDDVVNTQLIQQLLQAHCPDLTADVVSAGYRVGRTAPGGLVGLYEQIIGPYPAPANRRTWIAFRADPARTQKAAQRRDVGAVGLARYLAASTIRVADQLASRGIDARPAQSFAEFDRATAISFERETWSSIHGRGTFTAAYSASGGPDLWWSARADHTITRVRIKAGTPPAATVLLTTLTTPTTPQGFSCLFGGQRAALEGGNPVTDRHHEIPIGSAGVLVGETAHRYPVYMPFDDVNSCIDITDARIFAQFLTRSAAAGAIVTLGPQFHEFAVLINAHTGDNTKVAWPNATTFLDERPGCQQVTLRQDFIGTPRHQILPIRAIDPREESRYRVALDLATACPTGSG